MYNSPTTFITIYKSLATFIKGCTKVKSQRCDVMLVREGTDVRFKSCSNLHIDVEIHDGSAPTLWHATGFYGQPDVAKRYILWELMEVLKVQSSVPWVVFRDFNEISHPNEKLRGPERDAR